MTHFRELTILMLLALVLIAMPSALSTAKPGDPPWHPPLHDQSCGVSTLGHEVGERIYKQYLVAAESAREAEEIARSIFEYEEILPQMYPNGYECAGCPETEIGCWLSITVLTGTYQVVGTTEELIPGSKIWVVTLEILSGATAAISCDVCEEEIEV